MHLFFFEQMTSYQPNRYWTVSGKVNIKACRAQHSLNLVDDSLSRYSVVFSQMYFRLQ